MVPLYSPQLIGGLLTAAAIGDAFKPPLARTVSVVDGLNTAETERDWSIVTLHDGTYVGVSTFQYWPTDFSQGPLQRLSAWPAPGVAVRVTTVGADEVAAMAALQVAPQLMPPMFEVIEPVPITETSSTGLPTDTV
ncbi:unannotated protein [freshwater metagenome]|uniref:Unannotated protein n=1 Tax=freshwater metagenome TaxID=449393 RepID=A0A6J7PRB9_9ZZZZ